MSAEGPVTWRSEALDLVRGASGGLLFGVPLLYTMEVWWTGGHSEPHEMAAVLALVLIPVYVLNRTAGFREIRDRRFADAAADTIEAVALGLVVTTLVLILLREITVDTPLGAGLGKVVYESVPFCLGIGVARHFLHGNRIADEDEASGGEGDDAQTYGALADLGASTIGAVFFALNIAPTDEILVIARAMTPAWLLVMVGASLVVSYAVVFVAGFSRQDERHASPGLFQRPITETIICYLLALLAALVLLWAFQRGLEPWPDTLSRVVVLGFPAAIGGAAGRLAI